MKKPTILKLYPEDNVAVALEEIMPDTDIGLKNIRVADRIPAYHKVAIENIKTGERIIKFGQTIGVATTLIKPGCHVHVHNVAMSRFDNLPKTPEKKPKSDLSGLPSTFFGYRRADGQVGIRNYIAVIATCGCSASVVWRIVQTARKALPGYPAVDDVFPVVHQAGCGLAGKGMVLLQKIIRGYLNHPNLAGALVVGLGCEYNNLDSLLNHSEFPDSIPIHSLDIQANYGSLSTIQKGLDLVRDLLVETNTRKKEETGIENLIVGLQCGGSDAMSGLSANPALGRAVDLLVDSGATAVLAETPETYGAEQLLASRAADRTVADKYLSFIRWWEEYTEKNGGEMNNNPSPGNKAGGLTTILEKSLGAINKAGTRPLIAAYDYADRITAQGLAFMNTPGYDLTSNTGLIAGGAHLICFTTGCGTVAGHKPGVVIKLASNSRMYTNMEGDMDINCGPIIEGEATLEEVGREIFDKIVQVAGGQKSKSEGLGFGDLEFAPWWQGPVM